MSEPGVAPRKWTLAEQIALIALFRDGDLSRWAEYLPSRSRVGVMVKANKMGIKLSREHFGLARAKDEERRRLVRHEAAKPAKLAYARIYAPDPLTAVLGDWMRTSPKLGAWSIGNILSAERP